MGIRVYIIDAFTSRPFSGNPAGVCILEKKMDKGWMGDVARELNLSETAFLVSRGEGYDLRWFTPEVEVDLCGHATLAAVHALREEGLAKNKSVVFNTLTGELGAGFVDGLIELDFPSEPLGSVEPPPDLLKALGVKNPLYTGRSRLDYLVEIGTQEELKVLDPDIELLKKVPSRGVTVTCISGQSEYDFISRFFAPAIGIPEDPVTGSAHCCLGPFWAGRLGKTRLKAFQASSRGGELEVETRGGRVLLRGQAVTVLKGELK